MIVLQQNQLQIRFAQVHPDACASISFQRTLRIPDDNQDYPLPAGLGRFPVHAVDGFDVPPAWRAHGGVFLPMYQSEALWIDLDSAWPSYPMAVKIAAGKINAVTGEAWRDALGTDPQDYLVIPEQPWLDGFNVQQGLVRQFVAAPMGAGLTAEEQITGAVAWGGLQLVVYPMKAEVYRELRASSPPTGPFGDYLEVPHYCRRAEDEMGLAPGGRIRQEIAEDPYGMDAWDTSVQSRCFVHLLDSTSYHALTGRRPPPTPIDARAYRKAGIPWFDYYREGKSLPGSNLLARLDGLAAAMFKQGKSLGDNAPIAIAQTIDLRAAEPVRDSIF